MTAYYYRIIDHIYCSIFPMIIESILNNVCQVTVQNVLSMTRVEFFVLEVPYEGYNTCYNLYDAFCTCLKYLLLYMMMCLFSIFNFSLMYSNFTVCSVCRRKTRVIDII